jgi:glucose-1-phosphate thymidylyltransferase
VQSFIRVEYAISDAIDLLIQSGRTIDAIGIEGWRVDVGYPEDREKAEKLLQGDFEGSEAAVESADGD